MIQEAEILDEEEHQEMILEKKVLEEEMIQEEMTLKEAEEDSDTRRGKFWVKKGDLRGDLFFYNYYKYKKNNYCLMIKHII